MKFKHESLSGSIRETITFQSKSGRAMFHFLKLTGFAIPPEEIDYSLLKGPECAYPNKVRAADLEGREPSWACPEPITTEDTSVVVGFDPGNVNGDTGIPEEKIEEDVEGISAPSVDPASLSAVAKKMAEDTRGGAAGITTNSCVQKYDCFELWRKPLSFTHSSYELIYNQEGYLPFTIAVKQSRSVWTSIDGTAPSINDCPTPASFYTFCVNKIGYFLGSDSAEVQGWIFHQLCFQEYMQNDSDRTILYSRTSPILPRINGTVPVEGDIPLWYDWIRNTYTIKKEDAEWEKVIHLTEVLSDEVREFILPLTRGLSLTARDYADFCQFYGIDTESCEIFVKAYKEETCE